MQGVLSTLRRFALPLGAVAAICVVFVGIGSVFTSLPVGWIIAVAFGGGLLLAATILLAGYFGASTDPYKYHLERQVEILKGDREEVRHITRAFLQMGAQYALICRPDGRLIEANADFYARCRLHPNALDEEKQEALRELIPLDELGELANRSMTEDVALTGIPALFVFPEGPRQVQVSLRAIELGGEPAILMVVADKKRETELERQIDQFSDSVELMVDQRVARITAGGITAESALAKAGVAIARFEDSGTLMSMNPVAEQLTGRTSFSIRNIEDFLDALRLDKEHYQALHEWYHAGEAGSLLLDSVDKESNQPILVISAHEQRPGQPRHRLLVWIPVVSSTTNSVGYFEHLRGMVSALSLDAFPPEAHPYIEVIREAVERIDRTTMYGGDGAFITPVAQKLE